ncbi:phage tail tape measure protein, core region [gamma proteobacterium HTCC5015]|nr:phage tail tape measure protein, core region [gamma proteobacterium HTCC5015]
MSSLSLTLNIQDNLKQVQKSLKGLNKEFSQTSERVKKLRKIKNLTRDWERHTDAIKETRQGLDTARERLRRMQQEMNRGGKITKKFRNEYEIARRNVKRMEDTLGHHNKKLSKTSKELKEAGFSTKNYSQSIKKLNQNLEKQDAKLAKLHQRKRKISELDEKHGKQMRHQAAVATGAAAYAYGSAAALRRGAGLLTSGVDYGAMVSELQAVARLQKNSQQMAGLKQQSRSLGASTQFSASEVVGGQIFLARAGLTPEAIGSSMRDVLNLAMANNIELDQAADISSNIAGAFKLDPEIEGNMKRVADVLSGTAARANVDLQMLGDTMKYLGQAEGLNVSIEQGAALSGLLGNIGIQGSQAGTTIRAMLSRLSAPVGKAKDAIAELKLEISDESGNMRAITDILADVDKATANMGNVARAGYLKQIFGEEAGSGVSELIKQQGSGSLAKLIKELGAANGEAQRMADTMKDNQSGDLKALASAWEAVKLSINDAMEPLTRPIIQWATKSLRSLSEVLSENAGVVKWVGGSIAVILGAVSAISSVVFAISSALIPLGIVKFALQRIALSGGVLGGVARMLTGVMSGLVGVLKWLGKGILWLGRLMLTNPIGLLVTAIVLGAYLIYKHWDAIKSYFKNLWAELTADVRGVVSAFNDHWVKGFGAIATFLTNWSPLGFLYKGIAKLLSYFGIDLPEKFTEFGANILQGLWQGFKNMMPELASNIEGLAGKVGGWFKDKLGIHSPSRVFAEFGHHTLAGYQQGIKKQTLPTLNQVGGVSRRIAQAGAGLALAGVVAAPAAAYQVDGRAPLGSAKGSGAMGDTIHITVQAAAGSSGHDIAQQIAQVLDRRDREKAARRRSSLYDTE